MCTEILPVVRKNTTVIGCPIGSKFRRTVIEAFVDFTNNCLTMYLTPSSFVRDPSSRWSRFIDAWIKRSTEREKFHEYFSYSFTEGNNFMDIIKRGKALTEILKDVFVE